MGIWPCRELREECSILVNSSSKGCEMGTGFGVFKEHNKGHICLKSGGRQSLGCWEKVWLEIRADR